LPADPLQPSFDRCMVAVGDDVFLFEHELVPNPGSERPALTRAARYDLDRGVWERRADSEILGAGPWFTEGGMLVNAALGEADGGQVNNWGRFYPEGGVYDSSTDTWSSLPNPPRQSSVVVESGVIGEFHAWFSAAEGTVLDWVTGEWIAIPRLPDATDSYETSPYNRTVVAAGTDLFVFGGERWDHGTGSVLDAGYVWPTRTSARRRGTSTPVDPPTTRPDTSQPSTVVPGTSTHATPTTPPSPSTDAGASTVPVSRPSPPPSSGPTDGFDTFDGPLLRAPFDDGDG
jgi:hypothetical protein